MDVNKTMQTIVDVAILVGFKVVGAIVFYLVGRWLISFAIRLVSSALERQKVDPTLLRAMHAGWPFIRALLDNAEMSLLKADLGIAALYSGLVSDRHLAAGVFASVEAEYMRTRDAILEVTGHRELLDGDPVIQRSIHLRNPYVDPLNYLQIEMLRRLRALPDLESPEADALREVIVLTINGIAAGLRNTG